MMGKEGLEGRLVAPCGIDCKRCKAYKATQENDDETREEVAEEWSRAFNISIAPTAIHCDGCTAASERKIEHHKDCPIRLCVLDRGLETCADCLDYPCEKLMKLHEIAKEAKELLEEIRSKKWR
jgi:hypothetical protein